MKRTLVITLRLLAIATLGLASASSFAAEKTAAAEKKAEKAEIKDATGKTPAAAADAATKEASGKPFPYSGKVSKIDPAGKTITLGGKVKERVITLDAATKITKAGAPATLAELTVGEAVTGQVTKTGDTETAKSLKIGGKGEAGDPAAKAGTAPLKATPAGTGALAPGDAAAKTGAGAPGSSSAGPGVKGAPKPGGEAPAGAKKN